MKAFKKVDDAKEVCQRTAACGKMESLPTPTGKGTILSMYDDFGFVVLLNSQFFYSALNLCIYFKY